MTMLSQKKPIVLSNRGLEMLMRDVLDGLEEFALMMAFESDEPDIEIIPEEKHTTKEINPLKAASSGTLKSAEIINIRQYQASK